MDCCNALCPIGRPRRSARRRRLLLRDTNRAADAQQKCSQQKILIITESDLTNDYVLFVTTASHPRECENVTSSATNNGSGVAAGVTDALIRAKNQRYPTYDDECCRKPTGGRFRLAPPPVLVDRVDDLEHVAGVEAEFVGMQRDVVPQRLGVHRLFDRSDIASSDGNNYLRPVIKLIGRDVINYM